MKRISFKIFLFLNCLTYGFIGLYVLINYLFLEDYQISLKKKELATLAKEYNHKNYFSLRENSQQNGIFLRELPLNVLEGENKFKKFHPLKISQEELEERLKNSQEIIETQVGRDNINRIILIKKVDSEKLLIVTASVAPITEVIASTLKFFIYIIIFSIPFNLYVAYKLSMRMGRPIESELLTLNAQLKKELEKQKQSEIFRKNFISNVTHELKTPVAIIDGYSEAILDGIISPDEIPSICINISKEAFNINTLVQELLFYAKMESGYIEIKKENLSLKKLLENILSRYVVDFRVNIIDLNLNLKDIYLESDKKLLGRALNNIIINALAYVDLRKKIDIILNENEIVIKNTSDNLKDENFQEYFKPFSKKKDKKVRKYGGTGLGLSVVSEILRNLSLQYQFYYEETTGEVIFKILLRGEKNEKISGDDLTHK